MKKYLFKLLVVAVVALPFVACNNDDDPEWIEPEIKTTGAYILNTGNGKQNDATLQYYDVEKKTLTKEVFKNVNDQILGDVAQDMVIYGGKMYISVNGSNKIFVTDLTSKILNTISPKTDSEEPLYPRSLIAHNGKVYASTQTGHILRIDTTSMNIDNKLKAGSYTEQMTIINNKLYAANSGWGADKTVSVVTLNDFKEETKINVIVNPCFITNDNNGNIYVISMGNYDDIKPTLQKIEVSSNKVSVIGTSIATQMKIDGDRLLLIYVDPINWGTPAEFYYYNTKESKLVKESFIEKTAEVNLDNANTISIDPVNKDLYITNSAWGSKGTMYIFSNDGKYKSKFSTEGYYPMGAYFMTK